MEMKMTIQREIFSAPAIRFSVWRDGEEVGHAYLYIMTNDGHEVPFGYLEDVYVSEVHRKCGIGNELVQAVIDEARKRGCYKLVATSRNDGTRETVHKWYIRYGFSSHSTGFRMDF